MLLVGFVIRLILVFYAAVHDYFIGHIKFTDVDYHVFNNGSKALFAGKSPYDDEEYRYSPLVALIFLPNVLNPYIGKLMIIIADVLCGYLQYTINIQQGTQRLYSKAFLLLWLFNPFTISISARGSFEPMLVLLILTFLYSLVNNLNTFGGMMYGLAIHLKLYPIIYSGALYLYLIKRRPYMITQSKLTYWLKTLSPNSSQLRFFISSGISLLISSYASYIYFGEKYLDQSFLYHIRRKDLQHNFSPYFYLFKLLPSYQDNLSKTAFISQIIGILTLTLLFSSFETNRRTKLRKLTFSLFTISFVFVSLNKVCTSQYFYWYIVFLPLIVDSIHLKAREAYLLILTWCSTQAIWLFCAYLFEYQKLDVLHFVGGSSLLFFGSNIYILFILCSNFDARGSLNKDR